ncbi:MAG TPA: uroporphyrinogen-III synthase [Geminicoccaceae bacterium]|nr:uroporphyrinogen-III synthase [Geminicoccaceae bacterium]
MLVLVTRPADAAADFAGALRALGHEPLTEPMLTVRPLSDAPIDLDGVQAVLLTSANAVPALPPAARALRVLTVGEATAAAARRAGCPRVDAAAGDAAALARLAALRLRPGDGALLHLAGARTREGLAEGLAAAGFALRRVVVYEAVPAAALSARLRAVLARRGLDAATFFSPETAATFVRLVRRAGLADGVRDAAALCLSPAVAGACHGLPWREVRAAPRPSGVALLELLEGPRG